MIKSNLATSSIAHLIIRGINNCRKSASTGQNGTIITVARFFLKYRQKFVILHNLFIKRMPFSQRRKAGCGKSAYKSKVFSEKR